MARKTDQGTDKAAVLERLLRGTFRKLENRPVPDHLRAIVDQLETVDQPVRKAGRA